MGKVKYKYMDTVGALPNTDRGCPKKSDDGQIHRDHNDNTVNNNNAIAAASVCSDVELDCHRNYAASPMYRREMQVVGKAPGRENLSQDFRQFKLPAVVNSDRFLADVRNGSWPSSEVAVEDQANRRLRGIEPEFIRSSSNDDDRLIPALQEFKERVISVMEPARLPTPSTQAVNTATPSNPTSVTPLDILSSVACAEHRRLASHGADSEKSSSKASQSDRPGNFVKDQVSCTPIISAKNVSTSDAVQGHVCSSSAPICQPMSNSNLLPTGPVCSVNSVNANQRLVCVQESNLVPRRPPLYTSPALPPVCVDANGTAVMQRVDNCSIKVGQIHTPRQPTFVALPTAMTLPITTIPADKQLAPSNNCPSPKSGRELTNPEWRPQLGKSPLHRKRRKQKSSRLASSPEVMQSVGHASATKPGHHVPCSASFVPGEMLKSDSSGQLRRNTTFMPALPCTSAPVKSAQKTYIPLLEESNIPKFMMRMISLNQFPLQSASGDHRVYDSFKIGSREPSSVPKKSPASSRLTEHAQPVTNGKYLKKQVNREAEEITVGEVYSNEKPMKSNSTVNNSSSSTSQCIRLTKENLLGHSGETNQLAAVTSSSLITTCGLGATSVVNTAYPRKITPINNLRLDRCVTSNSGAISPTGMFSIPNESSIVTRKNQLNMPVNLQTPDRSQLYRTGEAGLFTSKQMNDKCSVSSKVETLLAILSTNFSNLSDQNVKRKISSKSGATHGGGRKRVAEEVSKCKWAKRRRPNDAVIVCNLCQHTVKYNLEWKRHIKEKHWDLVKSFSCKECFIPFESKADFLKHLTKEHPKMLPSRLLPEKVFSTMIEEHKQFKRKPTCDRSNEAVQPNDPVIPNGAERVPTVQLPPPAKVCSQIVSTPTDTGTETESAPAKDIDEQKDLLTEAKSRSEQPAETDGIKCCAEIDWIQCSAEIDGIKCSAKTTESKCSAEIPEIKCSAEIAEIKCLAVTEDSIGDGNQTELDARRMSKDEGYTTDRVFRLDSGNAWQNDNDNASTKSYAESPDRCISDSDIPPTPTWEEPGPDDDECQLLFCDYPDDHQPTGVSGHSSPTFTKCEKAIDVSKKEERQEVPRTTSDQPKSSRHEKNNAETRPLRKNFIEVGNSIHKLNIRPGLLDARLFKRKYKKPRRIKVSRYGFKFRRTNNIKKLKRKTKVGLWCEDLDDATLPDLDPPGKEIKTVTDVQSDYIPSYASDVNTFVSESSAPGRSTNDQVCTSDQLLSEDGTGSGEEIVVELTEIKDKDASSVMCYGPDNKNSLDECDLTDTEYPVEQNKSRSEVDSVTNKSYSETTLSDVDRVLIDCRRCFVKLERNVLIDNLKNGGILRVSADGRLFEIPCRVDGLQAPVCRSPILQQAIEERRAEMYTLNQESKKNQGRLISSNEIIQPLEPDFTCDQGYGSNNWGCMLCTYSSVDYESLKQHVQKEHIATKRYFCPKCPVNSHEYSRVEDHVLYLHKDITAVVLSKRCPQEQELIDALCLWLPGELKWKNIKLKLERAARMSAFIRSKLDFNDSKRYTCYVCNKQIKSLVLIRKHVAAYWRLVNSTGAGYEEISTDSDVLKELFDKRGRVIPRRHSASLKDSYRAAENYRMHHSVQGLPDNNSNGKFRKSSKSKRLSSDRELTNAHYAASVDSSDSSLCGSTVDVSERPVRKAVEEGRSVWTTLEKLSDTSSLSSDLPCSLSADSPKPSYFASTSPKDCAACDNRESISLRLLRASGEAGTTNSAAENRNPSPVLSSCFDGPAIDAERRDQVNSLKGGSLFSDCNRLLKPDTKLNMKPTVLLQCVCKYSQDKQV